MAATDQGGRALEGLVVIEVSGGPGAAYCGRLLATYGARVVLVERPGGNSLREVGPFGRAENPRESGALFLTLGAGKESLALDLGAADGRVLFAALCRRADVLVTDQAPALEACGFGYAALAASNPRLVFASVTPFGDSGPYAGFTATSATLYALGGYTYITGDAGREPLQGPEYQPEFLGGASAYAGVLAALYARRATGRGQRVEASALEAIAAGHQWTMTRYAYSGRVQERNGNRYNSLHPVTYYDCADGVVACSPSTPAQLQSMLQLIGREDLLADPRFATNGARMDNADAFDAEILPWFLARTRAEVFAECQAFRVPCAPVFEVEELLEHEQLVYREYWRPVSHPVAGDLRMPGPPFRLPDSPAPADRAPLLGEQTADVCRDLAGLDAAAVTALRDAGVLR